MMNTIRLNISYSQESIPDHTNIRFISDEGEVCNKLPFVENSIAEIYSENLLEKLSQCEGVRFLKECRRVLEPGGTLRIVTLNLDRIVNNYNDNKVKVDLPWADNNSEMINYLMSSSDNKWIYNFNEINHLANLAGLVKAEERDNKEKKSNLSKTEQDTNLNFSIDFHKKKAKIQKEESPLVSVLIPAYNWKYFEESLQSAINQTYKNIEIIISDDSLDEQIKVIVDKYAHEKRITYLKNKKNIGEYKNYAKCFDKSHGEYIKFLNDDDKLENNCIERMVFFFQTDPNLSIVTSHRDIIDTNSVVQPEIMATRRIVQETSVLEGSSTANLILKAGLNFIGEPSSILVKREDLVQIEPHFFDFSGHKAIGAGDVSLYLNLLSKGNVLYIFDTLSYFRIHDEQRQKNKQVHEEGIKSWNFLRFHGSRLGFLHPNDKQCLEYRTITNSEWQSLDYSSGKLEAAPIKKSDGPGIERNGDASYNLWKEQHTFLDSDLTFFSNVIAQQTHHSEIHVLIKITRGEEHLLADTIDSIGAQVYTNWYLSVVANFECPDPIFDELEQLQWIECQDDLTEKASEIAQSVESDWLISPKPGDILDSAFLYFLYVHTETNPSLKFIYTDEDTVDNEGNFVNPRFKPDCNLDLIRSMNYIGNACAIRKEALTELQKGDKLDCTNNYDLFLRIHDTFEESSIGHIATILFHSHDRKDEKTDKLKDVDELSTLKEHFKRNNISCTISEGILEKTHFVQYELIDTPLVSIIIPTKNNATLLQKCIVSIYQKTDYKNYEILIVDNNSTDPATISFLKTISVSHPNMRVLSYSKPFNYSAINNFAAKEAKGEYLLLLNDDTEALQGPWLERMLQHAQRKDIGAVGARLVYSSRKLQHAGVILGLAPLAHHPGIGQDIAEPGYMNRFQVVQNFSAVTAACLLVKKSRYFEVGGLDENGLKVLFNDVDLCLKLGKAGYRNVWTPYATLIHHGSSSIGKKIKRTKKEAEQIKNRVTKEHKIMKERWMDMLANDPSYNKNLSLNLLNYNIDTNFPAPWDQTIADRLKIAAIPNTSTGSTHYRISSPLSNLRKMGVAWDAVLPAPVNNNIPNVFHLRRMAPDSLILHSFFCQQNLLKQYKQHTNTCLIYGLDDLITHVSPNNPTYELLAQNAASRLKGMLSLSDRLLVSTEPLYDHFNKKKIINDIRILPNCLEGDRWLNLQSKKMMGSKIRIGWAGAQQHEGDLNIITEVIKETHKEVDWVFLGMCPENIRDFVLEFHPAEAFDKYPAKLASLNLDLAVAPLEINKFNEAKSNLRLLEYGVLGIPVIATDIFPYQNSPVKTVRNEKDQWIDAIRERVADIDATQKEGENLKEWVLNNFLLENNLENWLKALTP